MMRESQVDLRPLQDDQELENTLPASQSVKNALPGNQTKGGGFRRITVEPIVFFFMLAYYTQDTINEEYCVAVYDLLPPSNISEIDFKGLPPGQTRTAVSSAKFLTVLELVANTPSLFVTYFLGAFSEVVGRKPTFLIPLIGLVCGNSISTLIMYFRWDISWLFLGVFILDVSGGASVCHLLAYAYIADITTVHNRTMRMLIIHLVEIAALSIGQFISGFLIEYCGFEFSMMVMAMSAGIALLYTILFLKESHAPNKQARSNVSCSGFLKSFNILTKKSKDKLRRLKVFIYTYLVFIDGTYDLGGMDVLAVFLLNQPVNFSPLMVGYYFAFYAFLKILGTLAFTGCSGGSNNDWRLLVAGAVSAILGKVALSVPYYNWYYIYLATTMIGFMNVLIIPISRSALSKIVNEEEQVAMSAWASFIGQAAMLTGNTLLTYIYSATYSVYINAVFCIGAALYFLGLLFLILLKFLGDDDEAQVSSPQAMGTSTPINNGVIKNYGAPQGGAS